LPKQAQPFLSKIQLAVLRTKKSQEEERATAQKICENAYGATTWLDSVVRGLALPQTSVNFKGHDQAPPNLSEP
jgi:hypothetical protein